MKKYYTIGYRLPRRLATPLFGDRNRFGYEPKLDDKDWQEWQSLRHRFYRDTQRQGIGETVNDAGYKIMQEIDLTGKHVMEIGPGALPHIRYWKGKPQQYTLVDIQQNILDLAGSILKERGIQVNSHLVASPQLPIPSGQIDVLISFYSLEHLYPLDNYISELERVLKPGGVFIGAIPAEGGLAWGVGRFLTSRRYIKKNFQIDPDKIISWMHPNFANKIMAQLDDRFNVERWKFWPFLIPSIDMNLIISFVGRKHDK